MLKSASGGGGEGYLLLRGVSAPGGVCVLRGGGLLPGVCLLPGGRGCLFPGGVCSQGEGVSAPMGGGGYIPA